MVKPYQKDIDLLKKELEYHTFIAEKFSQEHDDENTQKFISLCAEIQTAITAMKARQAAAVSEWTSLPPSKQQLLLSPLFQAVEFTADNLTKNGCPEFAYALEQFLTNYLLDLSELKEQ